MKTPRVTLLSLAILFSLGGSSAAQPAAAVPPPEDPVALAVRLYAEGHYAAAAGAFESAYAAAPDPALLYAWGQALRQAGNCARAIEIYDKFIASNPRPEDRGAAEEGRAACAASLPKPPEPKPTPSPPAPSAPDPVESRPWYGDTLGAVLVGAGAVGLAAGGGLYLWARAGNGTQDTYGETVDAHDEARSRRTIAVITAGVGAGLVVAGLVRYLTVDHEPERANVAIGPIDGGLAAGVVGRW